MYELYTSPFSQHGRRVVSLLEEAAIPYTARIVDFDAGEHLSPQFRAMNPNHQVPVLKVDGEVLLESNAILRFVCDRHGLDAWYPKEGLERARVDQWLDWNQCRLGTATSELVLNTVFLGDKGDAYVAERARAKLEDVLAVLEQHLADRSFVAADRPTIADLSIVSNCFQLGFARATPTSPNIGAWLGRVGDLSGYRASLPPPR